MILKVFFLRMGKGKDANSLLCRRMLMILKLSDLQRSLDQSLVTTHGQSRVFVIVARYCAKAGTSLAFFTTRDLIFADISTQTVWQADYANFRKSLSTQGFSLNLFKSFISSFFDYAYWNTTLGLVELGLDARARSIKIALWFDGLVKGGLKAAEAEMAGLSLNGAIPATV